MLYQLSYLGQVDKPEAGGIVLEREMLVKQVASRTRWIVAGSEKAAHDVRRMIPQLREMLKLCRTMKPRSSRPMGKQLRQGLPPGVAE